MPRSMTGFGSARVSRDRLDVTAEIKTVNGRFFKMSLKAPQALNKKEPELESLFKARIRRGSVSVTLRLEQHDPEKLVNIDEEVVRAYQAAFRRLGLAEDRIPQLPGVIAPVQEELSDELWAVVTEAANAALKELEGMRDSEGRALAKLVEGLCQRIDELRGEIATRAPVVVVEYRDRLTQRVEKLLDGSGVTVDPQQIAREVAVAADRADIVEEIDRLGAHLEQIRELLQSDDEVGRKLDFLAQEMLREVNTIGSKSSDAEISHRVVALKSEVERIKEQVANIE